MEPESLIDQRRYARVTHSEQQRRNAGRKTFDIVIPQHGIDPEWRREYRAQSAEKQFLPVGTFGIISPQQQKIRMESRSLLQQSLKGGFRKTLA